MANDSLTEKMEKPAVITDPYETMTEYQQRFVDLYAGNATQAIIDAGYRSDKELTEQEYRLRARKAAYRMLLQPKVRTALSIRGRRESKYRVDLGKIADRHDIEVFWTDMMENPELDWSNRRAASENLAKSQGMFIERKIIEGGDKPVVVSGNLKLDKLELETRVSLLMGEEFE